MSFLINLKDIKKNFLKKENIYFLILIVLIFLTDRISKYKIINNFDDETFYVNNFINLELIWNIGVGFGFLSTSSTILYNSITITILIVIFFLIYTLVTSAKIDKFIYSVIIGGAFGNFYDRIIYRAVPDFIDIHYNNFHWFTFNLADIFITIGIIIYILRSFFVKN
tara:strand:- start:328 stop:828 length:501 start_codon:yes stop_codon:yes gene_type:complete